MDASRDENFVPTLLGVSSTDGVTPVTVYVDPITHRLLVDLPGGSGTVSSVSVVTANGFAGTVANATSTPAITLTTTITGLLVGNGTSIAAAVSGTDIKTINSTSILGAGNIVVSAAPGGSNTQVQYNNAGALAGITGATTNGTALTLVAPVLGTPASGVVTNLTGTASININGTVGATTPTTGVFTTLSATSTTSLLLGTSGSTVGNIGFRNATSGTITLAPVAGALGTVTLTLPAITDTLVTLTSTQALTNKSVNGVTIVSGGTATLYLSQDGTYSTPAGGGGANTALSNLASVAINTTLLPGSNDGAALGSGALAFSDLFLANGGVINWSNGNAAITHSTGTLTVSTGDFRVTTAGTNAASVVTTAGTQTLTNKRPQPRTASSTTASTLTPDLSSANVYFRTTQTATLTIEAPIGTPVIGETIMIYVDSAGAQTLTINATYIPFGAAFPATTTAGKTFMLSAQYNGTNWKTLWANAI